MREKGSQSKRYSKPIGLGVSDSQKIYACFKICEKEKVLRRLFFEKYSLNVELSVLSLKVLGSYHHIATTVYLLIFTHKYTHVITCLKESRLRYVCVCGCAHKYVVIVVNIQP